MVVRKWRIDLPVEEILPLKETWKFFIKEHCITRIIRNDKEYTLKEQTANNDFIYENGKFYIALHICRDPSGSFAGVEGIINITLQDSHILLMSFIVKII